MRCLFCDKKLSLLRLAKRDGFCSTEHFDAYRLQMSKHDIERLMGLPIADAPKAPLVVPFHEEPPKKSGPDNGDLSRLLHEVLQPPPPVSFAKPPLPSFPPAPSSPVAREPVAHIEDESRPNPALPVHDVEVET